MSTTSLSHLQEVLSRGAFAVTAECGPPRGADPETVIKKGALLKDCIDAVNVTDNQTAIVRMSSIGAATHLVQMGLEPVMQMVVRDRNRIALQSDILGASALGLVSEMPTGPGPIPEELIAEIAATVPPAVATFLLTSLTDPTGATTYMYYDALGRATAIAENNP